MNVPLNIDWQQICLHLLNFLILFAVLYFLLYKPVKDFMQKRADYYKGMDSDAEKKLADAEKAKAEYESKLSEVESEITAKKERARLETEEVTQRRINQAEDEAAQIISSAQERAELEKKKILSSAQSEISSLVADATEKLVINAGASEVFDRFLSAAEGSEANE